MRRKGNERLEEAHLDLGTVAVLVLGELPDKVDPPLADVPQPHAQVNQPDVAGLTLLEWWKSEQLS